jgi:hemerythrin
MIEWKRSYSVQIRKIDLQHRKVLGIINRLYSMQTNQLPEKEMQGLFVSGDFIASVRSMVA